jgi:hypothetical protein
MKRFPSSQLLLFGVIFFEKETRYTNVWPVRTPLKKQQPQLEQLDRQSASIVCHLNP